MFYTMMKHSLLGNQSSCAESRQHYNYNYLCSCKPGVAAFTNPHHKASQGSIT